jgi:hypothetical protein
MVAISIRYPSRFTPGIGSRGAHEPYSSREALSVPRQSREIDSHNCTVGPYISIAGPPQFLSQWQPSVRILDARNLDQRHDIPLPPVAPMQFPIGFHRLNAMEDRRSAGERRRIAKNVTAVVARG